MPGERPWSDLARRCPPLRYTHLQVHTHIYTLRSHALVPRPWFLFTIREPYPGTPAVLSGQGEIPKSSAWRTPVCVIPDSLRRQPGYLPPPLQCSRRDLAVAKQEVEEGGRKPTDEAGSERKRCKTGEKEESHATSRRAKSSSIEVNPEFMGQGRQNLCDRRTRRGGPLSQRHCRR